MESRSRTEVRGKRCCELKSSQVRMNALEFLTLDNAGK